MKTISFKVSEEDALRIRQSARQAGMTLSDYLRRRAIGGSGRRRRVGKVHCRYTGARIFAPLPDEPPLTTERVRSMLSEFP